MLHALANIDRYGTKTNVTIAAEYETDKFIRHHELTVTPLKFRNLNQKKI